SRKALLMRGTRKTLLAIGALMLSFIAEAQTGTIRGFIYEEGSGEPVIFTNIYLKGTTYGAATDVNGYYSISKIAPGDYTLMVTYLGYDTLKKSVSVQKDAIMTENLFLKKGAIQMKTFTISAEKQEAQHQVQMAVTKLTPR